MIDESSRLKPERVRKSYRTIGLEPTTGQWVRFRSADSDMGPSECCGAGAVFIAETIDRETDIKGAARRLYAIADTEGVEGVAEEFGVDPEYLQGFIEGFDATPDITTDDPGSGSEDFILGFSDGFQSARLVFGELETSPTEE